MSSHGECSVPDYESIASRIRKPMGAALRQLAEEEQRSVSNIIAIMLSEALQARGAGRFDTRCAKRGRKAKVASDA
jgi:hypothetical protein